jgi:hypothetical protein
MRFSAQQVGKRPSGYGKHDFSYLKIEFLIKFVAKSCSNFNLSFENQEKISRTFSLLPGLKNTPMYI